MELFRTEDFYIFVEGEHSLWWDRQTGAFIPKTGWDLTDAEDPICLGVCQGLIGKVEHPSVFDARLLLIKEGEPIGCLHGAANTVYKIKSIAFLPLGRENVDLNLPQCPKHKTIGAVGKTANSSLFDIQKNAAFTKTWGTLKSAGNTIKSTTQQAAAKMVTNTAGTNTPKKRDTKDKEKFERQILEEFHKIFTDTNSFYYSRTTDLTNSLQRLCNLEKNNALFDPNALWKTVDDRFFWNRNMLKELIEINSPLCDPWILPIIQGYIQIEDCKVQIENDIQGVKTTPKFEVFTLCIISRRSRFRAGTRYKRRGVDDNGQVANYVETEQLIVYHSHEVSFVQIRGSVPVYWSQPGYKYRPPPRIDKGEVETMAAFEKHFSQEIQTYGPLCLVNLVDQTGKEKVIWDAYTNYVFQYNSPFLTYVTFDFHEYCRGMHFENVSILINSMEDIVKDMNYCWKDKQGHICSQTGVFRVNCIDCLDRTNVVQTALGKAVMEIQFCKLGLISPEGTMPDSIKSTFQLLWANNGDIISKQYAGTNALKGDYTRTGERKFTGIMKDGMNSANRYLRSHFSDSLRQCCLDLMLGNAPDETELMDCWQCLRIVGEMALELLPEEPPQYVPSIALGPEIEMGFALYHMARYYLSRFKDATRQGTIDLMLGNYVSEDIFSESKHQIEEDSTATAEHVKLLIEDCKKMLINSPELVLGAWGLINADPSTCDPNETEMDAILILTKDSYFVADYDDQVDRVTKYQRVLLKDVTLLECGVAESASSLFKSTKGHYCVRLNYTVNNVSGYYHMFRSTNLRFFNNMAVVIRNEEEEIESLRSICEAFMVALELAGLPQIPYAQASKLERRKSKIVSSDHPSSNVYLDIVGLPHLTRNVSEGQLLALKSAGTKALSNVTQQFSKLNKLGTPFKNVRAKHAKFTIGFGAKQDSSSDSEEEEYENSIFQPNEDGGSLHYATDSSSSVVEEGVEVMEDSVLAGKKVEDAFLPSVGIVMGSQNETESVQATLERKENMLTSFDNTAQTQVDNLQLTSIVQNPEIHVSCDPEKLQQPKPAEHKLSHSCGEMDNSDMATPTPPPPPIRATTSATDMMSLNISQSQSESALKNKLQNLTSPVANVTKDLVLSPFSKLAKGMQNFGANLDVRKLSVGGGKPLSGGGGSSGRGEWEEQRRVHEEKWKDCKTRLIML